MKCKRFSSFEQTMVSIKLTSNTKLILITIYRLLFVSAGVFIDEFTEFLEILSVMSEDFILSGDINFHLETDDSHVKSLHDLWNSFNLVQHVLQPTHNLGHSLDCVLTRRDTLEITNLVSDNVQLSDHFMIHFDIKVEVLKYEEKTYRNLKAIDYDKFST